MLERLRRGPAGQGGGLVVVSGPAGVGKTALVVAWLRGLLDAFPDGQLYVDLKGHRAEAVSPGEVLGRFVRALGVAAERVPEGLDERAGLFRSMVAGRRVAVLLDNALSAAQVRPLLSGSPGCLTVVTSRHRLSGLLVDGARFHQVGPMGQRAAVELFARLLGRDRVAGQEVAAGEVARLCGGFPLAVSLAAARLVSRPRWPVGRMADALAGERDRLAVLTADDELGVRAALDFSYRALPAGAAGLYRRAALHPGPWVENGMAAAAATLSLGAAIELLEVLVEASLLDDLDVERYRFHDLVRLHALQHAGATEPEAERARALGRVVEYHLRAATAAEELLTPYHRTLPRTYAHQLAWSRSFPGPAEALEWLEAERDNLVASVRCAAERGLHATAWQLVDAMWPLFRVRKHYDDWATCQRLGLAAARAAQDPAGEARMLSSAGTRLLGLDQPAEAADCFQTTLRISRRIGNRRDEAGALTGLGTAARRRGDLGLARRYHHEALAVHRAVGYRRGCGLASLNLGEVALAAGDPAEAARLLAQAREDLSAEDDRYDAARALALLAQAEAHTSGIAGARDRLARALAELRATRGSYEEARVLEAFGLIAEQAADIDTARAYYSDAYRLFDQLPIPRAHAQRVGDRLRRLDPDP